MGIEAAMVCSCGGRSGSPVPGWLPQALGELTVTTLWRRTRVARRQKFAFRGGTTRGCGSYFGMTRATGHAHYVERVSRAKLFLTAHALDVLLVVLALAALVGTALRTDPYRPSGLGLWLEMAAIALL